MPDDSSNDFKASQQRHAQEIAATRTVSKITGVPFSQLRRVTREQKRAESRQAQRQPIDPPRPISETNPNLGPSPLPNGFPTRAMVPDNNPRGGGKAAPADAPLGTTQLIVDNNGTLEYWNFNAQYDSDV